MRVKQKRGDTLIEVMFAITVFALIAVISVNLMNGGVYTAQKSLEITMARNEIDAQSEALRFIQHSYLAEKELSSGKEFLALWKKLTNGTGGFAQRPEVTVDPNFNINNLNTCSQAYEEGDAKAQVFNYNAFVVNTRLIQPDAKYTFNGVFMAEVEIKNYDALLGEMIVGARDGKLEETSLFPRILYSQWGGAGGVGDDSNEYVLKESGFQNRRIAAAQGIWIISVKGGKDVNTPGVEPEYYDFYIRTCWHPIGRRAPATVGSIVRLYNPEVVD